MSANFLWGVQPVMNPILSSLKSASDCRHWVPGPIFAAWWCVVWWNLICIKLFSEEFLGGKLVSYLDQQGH